MTKETFYEMCDQLGSTPEKDKIPIDYTDLSTQTKDALLVFEYCMDKWDAMGRYMGKDLSNLKFIFKLLDIDKSNWLLVFDLLTDIISFRVESVNMKMENKARIPKINGVNNNGN
jgi:hypothetical protein